MKLIKFFVCYLLCVFNSLLFGSGLPNVNTTARSHPSFEENKNQFPANVFYKADFGGSRLFLEKNLFTFVKYNEADLQTIHDNRNHLKENKNTNTKLSENELVHLHCYKQMFVNANKNVALTSENKSSSYSNYFIGNDTTQWASAVYSYQKIIYHQLYPNIDLEVYTKDDKLKYDYVLKAGANVNEIKVDYKGVDWLEIKNNSLVIKTSIDEVIESIPLAYQLIDEKQIKVKCIYKLSKNNIVSFEFPEGYNASFPLVIDPVLVAATYSSSVAVTYGHSAAFDNLGNIYTGGEAHSVGYPTTVGAFQSTFNASTDIAISKLNPAGSALIWATYLGGSDAEIPNSLIVNANQEIYILGATHSLNFPVSAGCYDNSQNGFTDIVVTHLNATGTALIGSTYIGGSADEGIVTFFGLNFHDGMRGEIVLDQFDNACVVNYTASVNFPTTVGAYDLTFNGGQYDAVVFKLSPNMSTLLWSTFLGGNGDDLGYGLRLNSSGDVYVTGLTTNNAFPFTAGAYQTSFQGGLSDGFISKFNSAGSSLVASTYFGDSSEDESYFVDIDHNDLPYVFGVTNGVMPISAGVYSNAGSGNFVSKLSQNLTTLTFSTVVGDGLGGHLEPEAFMVDECENIYIAGFGSDMGYPVTASALYNNPASTLGGTCYMATLSKDAISLMFGSFYFGTHVDGGTSRFDPSGTVYLGICMQSAGAVTTSWALQNFGLASYDIYVVKLDFQMAGVYAIASVAPNDTICLGQPITFTNTSNGVTYIWDFGDGSPISNVVSPTHIYSSVGNFTVTFQAIDPLSCNVADTSLLSIVVLPPSTANLGNDTTICGATNIVLNAGNTGSQFLWSTGATTQTITATSIGTYWVNVISGGCNIADTITINQITLPPLGSDTSLCSGTPLILNAGNPGSTFLWSTGASSQTISVINSGTYWVVASIGTCSQTDTMTATFIPIPIVELGSDAIVCPGEVVNLNAGNAGSLFSWSTGETTQSIAVTSIGNYWVTVDNSVCTNTDSILVSNLMPPNLGSDTMICNSNPFYLSATLVNGATFLWSTGATTASILVNDGGNYWVTVSKGNCVFTDSINITNLMENPPLFVPNCFTPNHDGLNDVFRPGTSDGNYSNYNLKIFDRWGEQLFETDDIFKGWDGKYLNSYVAPDVYVWVINYRTLCAGNHNFRRIGHIAVLK